MNSYAKSIMANTSDDHVYEEYVNMIVEWWHKSGQLHVYKAAIETFAEGVRSRPDEHMRAEALEHYDHVLDVIQQKESK